MEGATNTRGDILEVWGVWGGGQASASKGAASAGKEALPDLCWGDPAGCESGCVRLYVGSPMLNTGASGKIVGETGRLLTMAIAPIQEHCCHPDFF